MRIKIVGIVVILAVAIAAFSAYFYYNHYNGAVTTIPNGSNCYEIPTLTTKINGSLYSAGILNKSEVLSLINEATGNCCGGGILSQITNESVDYYNVSLQYSNAIQINSKLSCTGIYS